VESECGPLAQHSHRIRSFSPLTILPASRSHHSAQPCAPSHLIPREELSFRGERHIPCHRSVPHAGDLYRDKVVRLQTRIEASPGSTLIISDEALSSETGKGTEFVVIMSDEPQGGIKMRRRNPDTEFRYASPRNRLPYWSPFAGPYSRR
jgi:hypothetical protein